MTETVSRDAFQALVQDRGLNLTVEQFDEMREAYASILMIRERLRSPRGFDAEPSGVFRPVK